MAKLPKKQKLLSALDKMRHSGRAREMALLGRDHAGSAEFEELLDSLDGDYQQWQMRLIAARSARSVRHLMEGARHPYRDIRAAAISGLATFDLDMGLVVGLIDGASLHDRRLVVSTVRSSGNTAVADELLPWVFDRYGANEAAVVLPACSAAVVAEWLPQLDHSVANWAALARAHPSLFLDFTREQLSGPPISRPAWWKKLSPGITTLVALHVDDVLDLWHDFGAPDNIPDPLRTALNEVAGLAPDRVIELLLRPGIRRDLANNVRTIYRKLHKATNATLMNLGRALADNQASLAIMLGQVAPSRREVLFRHAVAEFEPSTLRLSQALLDVLPHKVRHTEAKRMLALSFYDSREPERLDLLGSIPLDDSWEELAQRTHASDATMRAVAYRRLILAVLRSGDHNYFIRLLDELQRMRNEQDPVRSVAMMALRTVPPSFVEPDDMERLVDQARFAAEARDTSHQTRASLQLLFQRLLSSGATADRQRVIIPCIDALALLSDRSTRLWSSHQQLPAGGEFILFDALSERMEKDVQAGRPLIVLSLAVSLGVRGHKIDGLQKLLWNIATISKSQSSAAHAAGLYVNQRGKKSERAGELMAFDSSASLLHSVFETLSIARQDLLDDAFKPNASRGRFATSDQAVVRLVHSPTRRWNTAQRQVYADHLASGAANEHAKHLQAAAVRLLGTIPEFGQPLVAHSLNHPDVLVAEAALAASAHGQQPELQLDPLLAYADTERARVAIYSAGRAARYASPTQVTASVRRLLANDGAKLTARKEALRILGRVRGEGAIEVFTEVWSQRPLHRDIAIALASSLRNYPDEPLTWQVLADMSGGSSDEALGVVNAASPLSWPANVRDRLGALVVPLAEHDDHYVRIAAWAGLLAWRPLSAQVADVVLSNIVDLDSSQNLSLAVFQLERLTDGFPADPLLARTVAELVAETPPPDSNAGAERDLPIPQRLHALSGFTPATDAGRLAMHAAGIHVADAGYGAQAPAFFVQAVDWSDPTAALHELADLGDTEPAAVPVLYDTVYAGLQGTAARANRNVEALSDVATELIATNAEAKAMVALAIVSSLGAESGWPQSWRDLLVQLRSNDSVWVRHQAHNIFTAAD